MEKSIFGKTFTKNTLPIAAVFMILPSAFLAQTQKQVETIKKQSDISTLGILYKNFKKNTLTTKQLKEKAKKEGILYSGESDGRFFELKGFDKKGSPIYYVTTNVDLASGTGVNKLNSSAGIFNLDGEGMIVYEWDGGGTRVQHQEFGGRAVQKDSPSALSDHATHVAGTLVASGVEPRAKGMAPKAKLYAYDWNDDTVEMTSAAIDGAILSNHSYGYLNGYSWTALSGATGWHWMGDDEDLEYKYYGKYSYIDANWDMIALKAPYYLPVKAAGNPRGDGPENGEEHFVRVKNQETGEYEWVVSTKVRQKNGGELGFDCINHGALGKNILTVGAVHKIPNGYQTPSDVTMASFSAFGPVDDGRIKPDISGVGVGVYSTNHSHNSSYTTMGGTSMATPNVTGSLLLLQEHYSKLNGGNFMKSATVKALAIHTANEAGTHDGPDYSSGWGLLNAYRAATTISTRGKYSLIEEKTLKNENKDVIEVTASGTEPLAVTISWTDPVNTKLSDPSLLNDRSVKALVNDLDVRVIYNGETFFPWKLDPENPSAAATKGDNQVDNVENIVIPNPVAGATYKIEISHKDNLRQNSFVEEDGKIKTDLENSPAQDYSLIVTGINNGVQKDVVLKSIKPKVLPVQYSENTPVEFEFTNIGTQDITRSQLHYKLVNLDNDNQVEFIASVDVGAIPVGETIKQEVFIDLTKSFTNYQIEGNLVAEGDEVEINNKNTTSVYGVLVDLTPPKTSHYFDFEDDFDRNGWSYEDTDKDGSSWMKYTRSSFANSGSNFALNFPSKDSGGTSDWLFSNPVKLKGGKIYRLTFYSKKFQSIDEYFSVHLGTEPNSQSMTTVIKDKVEPGYYYDKYIYEFIPNIDQIAYIGFHHNIPVSEPSYAVAIDDVTIDHADGTPWVDFKADKFTPTTFEVVSFTNQTSTASTQPVITDGYQWIFEPNTVTYQDGTNQNSEEPKVIFNQEGEYKVTLKATNSQGTDSAVKEAYIVAKNTPAIADFKASKTSIYQGESIVFTNASTGNPAPTEFEWTVTPSENIEFTSGTNANSINTVIKFSKLGTYTVSLKAKSLNNENITQKNIEVESVYAPVRNLTHTFDKTTNEVNLNWERPIMVDIYSENFDSLAGIPADMKAIDNNNDGQKWGTNATIGVGGSRAILSKSWTSGKAFTADDYLITPKLRKGAEILKYDIRHMYKERYDIYLVEAPESGLAPTVKEIQEGHKVYSFEGNETGKEYFNRQINIKDYTEKDFHIVFHHRTLKEDNGFNIVLDNITVGYDNTIKSENERKNISQTENENYKALYQSGKTLVEYTQEDKIENPLSENNLIVQYGIIDAPLLVGYQIKKNEVDLAEIHNINTLSHKDKIENKGIYTYEVYALYSDGEKSQNPEITVVEITELSANEVDKDKKIKIYPNPSEGNFTIEKLGINTFEAEVYDMSGKLIFKNKYKTNKANINLTQYPKGVYILNIIDNDGQKQSVKLIIK